LIFKEALTIRDLLKNAETKEFAEGQVLYSSKEKITHIYALYQGIVEERVEIEEKDRFEAQSISGYDYNFQFTYTPATIVGLLYLTTDRQITSKQLSLTSQAFILVAVAKSMVVCLAIPVSEFRDKLSFNVDNKVLIFLIKNNHINLTNPSFFSFRMKKDFGNFVFGKWLICTPKVLLLWI